MCVFATRTCMCVYTHTYVCVHAHVCVCTGTCMCVYMARIVLKVC